MGCKNGMDMLYPHAKFGGNLPPHGSGIRKSWEFFVSLFVTLESELEYRFEALSL